MNTRYDLLGYDKNSQLVLIGEIKKRFSASEAWASQLRRNILAHGSVPDTKFFLVALPDKIYLWKNAGIQPELVEPDYSADATALLTPYYEKAGVDSINVSGQTFEVLVAWLLRDLLNQDDKLDKQRQYDWLFESGLYEALQDGRIEQEAVVT